MSEKNTVARPYAKALFEIALADDTLDQWSEDLAQAAFMTSDPQVIELLKHPRFSNEERLSLLYDLMPHLASKMKDALKVIGQAKRLLCVPEMAFLFEQFKIEREHIMNVTVTSATEIHDQAFINKITLALQKRFEREIVLHFKVDSSVLGGAIIKAGDVVINGSLSGRVAQLRNALGI